MPNDPTAILNGIFQNAGGGTDTSSPASTPMGGDKTTAILDGIFNGAPSAQQPNSPAAIATAPKTYTADISSTQPQKSFLSKAASFIGDATGISGYAKGLKGAYDVLRSGGENKKVMDAVDQANALITQAHNLPMNDPRRKDMLAAAAEISAHASQTAQENIDRLNAAPSAEQMLGSTAKLATTIGAPLFAPETAAGRIGLAAGSGAIFGGAGAAEKNKDLAGILGDTAIGGVTGAVTGVALEGARSLWNYVTQNLPTRLYGSQTGFTNKEMADPKHLSALKSVIEEGRVGTRDELLKTAQGNIDKYAGQLKDVLANGDGSVSPQDVVRKIVDEFNKGGADYNTTDMMETLKSMVPNAGGLLKKGELDLVQANQLRQLIDGTIRPSAWLAAQPTPTQELAMALRRGFSNAVKDTADAAFAGTEQQGLVRGLFSDLSKEITLRDGLDRLAGMVNNNKALSLSDVIMASGGGGIGAILGGGIGSVPGAAAGIAANHILNSAPVNTGAAVLLNRLGSNLTPILARMEPATRSIVIGALTHAINGTTPPETAPTSDQHAQLDQIFATQ